MKLCSCFCNIFAGIWLIFVLLICLSHTAYAARTINSITLNGSSSVTVLPSQVINVAVKATVSGNGSGNRWESSLWQIGTQQACLDHADHQDTTATETFAVTSPSVPGSYAGIFTLYGTDNCNGTQTSMTLNDAIIVDAVIDVDYHFDEISWTGAAGEVLDSGGNNYHATAVNGPLTEAISPAIPGNPGTCGYGVFDGVNDYVALPPTYPDITKSFTITAWIRTRNNTRSGQRIFIDDPNNSQGFGFSLGDGGTGRVRFYSRSVNPIILDTPNVIQNDTWYFVAAVADLVSKTKRIYVFNQSGAKIADVSSTYSGSWGSDAGDASIGGENDVSGENAPKFHFEGNLDEIQVHESALSEAAIRGEQSRSRFCFNQAAEYRFDLCSETQTVIDDSGNGFDGTVLNGPLAIQTGQVCNAGYFDGVDDYVVVDDRNAFDNTSALTISGWINPENIRLSPAGTNARGVLSKRDNASSNVAYGIFFYSQKKDGKLYVDIDKTNNRFASNAVIPEGVWTHFAVVFDGTQPAAQRVKLYLNGNLDTTASESSTTIPDYNSNLYLGNLYFGTSQLKVYQGLLDEIRIVPEVLSAMDVQALMNYTRPGCQSCVDVDHIRIEHPGSGLTCQPAAITLRACADVACSTEATSPVAVTMTPVSANPPTWVGGETFTFTGHQTVQLRQTTQATLTLGLSNPNPVPTNGYTCYDSGVAGDCDIDFYDSGFLFDVPDLTSCQTSPGVSMQAVRMDDTSQNCIAAGGFANVTKTVNFWSSYVNPTTGTEPVSLSGTNIATSSPGTAIALNFDASATANFTTTYPDAGQIQLDARYEGVGAEEAGLVLVGTETFVARPVGLCVFSDDANADCATGDSSCSVFRKVDQIFNLKVKGVCWESAADTDLCTGNATTPNFELGTIAISQNLVAPDSLGSSAGSLGVTSIAMASADNGEHVINTQSVSEAGVYTFTATPSVYFGSVLPAATSTNIGRFTPDHFETAIIENGVLEDACSGFTYSGQPFTYNGANSPDLLITAVGSSGNTTVNYRDGFVKLTDPLQITMPPVTRDASNLGADGTNLLNLTWSPGTGTLAAHNDGTLNFRLSADQFVYTRETNALVAPINSDIKLPVNSMTDSDGIVATDVPRSFAPAATEIRYGRMLLQNAFGPETRPLSIPAQTEYFNGSGFVPNTLDSCTPYDSASLQLSNFQGSLLLGDTTKSGSGILTSGLGNSLSLSAPGVGHDGSLDLELDLSQATGLNLEWLLPEGNNPKAKATFGIFKGNKHLIYQRESVW